MLPGVPNAARLNFGGQWALEGYALSARTMKAGETFQLTTYWTAQLGTPTGVQAQSGRLFASQAAPVGTCVAAHGLLAVVTRETTLLTIVATPGRCQSSLSTWRPTDR